MLILKVVFLRNTIFEGGDGVHFSSCNLFMLKRLYNKYYNPKVLVSKSFHLWLGLVLLAGASIWLIPEKTANFFITIESNKRSIDWLDEFNEMSLLKDINFQTQKIPPETRHDILTFSRASGKYRLEVYDADRKQFWSTSLVNSTKYIPFNVAHTLSDYPAPVSHIEREKISQIDRIHGYSSVINGHGHNENRSQRPQPDKSFFTEQEHEILVATLPIYEKGLVKGFVKTYEDIKDYKSWLVRNIRIAVIVSCLFGFSVLCLVFYSNHLVNLKQQHLKLMQKQHDQAQAIVAKQRAYEIRVISGLNEWMQSCKSLNELFEIVSTFLENIFPNSKGNIYIYSNSRDTLEGVCTWNGAEIEAEILPESCWGLRRGRTYIYGKNQIEFCCHHAEKNTPKEYACLPIIAHGETIGLMHIMPEHEENRTIFTEETMRLATMFAEQVSMAIANVKLRDQLLNQSINDPLTGLYNRRYFHDVFRKYIQKADRKNTTIGLISIDVDHFKKFNDNHGHDAGDMVLKTTADTMKKLFTDENIPFRLGGEEFAVLINEADLEKTLEHAERLRTSIEELTVQYGNDALPKITLSAGISMYPDNGRMPQDLMKVADDNLYKAKSAGRNRVVAPKKERNVSSQQKKKPELRQAGNDTVKHQEKKDIKQLQAVVAAEQIENKKVS